MKYKTVFDLIAKEFGKAGIRHILVGGFAVNHHKVSRATGDADFLVAVDDIERAVEIMTEGGYKVRYRTKAFVQFESDDLRFMDVDLIIVDQDTLSGIESAGLTVKMLDHDFRIPSLNHLLALKFHAMKNNPKRRGHRDFMDVLDLIKANHVNVEDDSFRALCLDYGTQETYDSILNHIRGGHE